MSRSKSGLFLMELIIAIAFFAVSSAVCVQLFAMAYNLSSRSVGIQMAVMNAQSAAESFKLTGGDIDSMTYVLRADVIDGRIVAGFDENWNTASYDIRFEMVVETDTSTALATATISVTDNVTGEALYSLTVKRYLGVN